MNILIHDCGAGTVTVRPMTAREQADVLAVRQEQATVAVAKAARGQARLADLAVVSAEAARNPAYAALARAAGLLSS